jgi:hypothetical protein
MELLTMYLFLEVSFLVFILLFLFIIAYVHLFSLISIFPFIFVYFYSTDKRRQFFYFVVQKEFFLQSGEGTCAARLERVVLGVVAVVVLIPTRGDTVGVFTSHCLKHSRILPLSNSPTLEAHIFCRGYVCGV